jgi:hypothetical protein
MDFCSSTRIHEDQEGISAVTSYQMEILVDFVDILLTQKTQCVAAVSDRPIIA